MASSSSRVPGGSASKLAAKAGTSATNRSGARSSERAAGIASEAGTAVSSTLNPPRASQKGKAWIVTPLAPSAPPANPAESQNGSGEGPVSSRLRRVPGRPLSKTAYAVPSSPPPPSSGRSSTHSESANSPERKRGRYADSPRRGPSSFLRPPKTEQSSVGATGPASNSESPTLRRSYRGKHRVNEEEAEEPSIRHPKKRFSIFNPESNVHNRPTRRSSQKSPELSSTIVSPVKVKEEPGSDSSTDSEPIPTNKETTNNPGKTKSNLKPVSSQSSNSSSAKSLIPPPRISSRTKPGTTGSCASRSRRASRAGFASLPSDQRGMSGQEAVPGPSHASSANSGPSVNSASGNNQTGAAASGGAAAVGLVSEAFGGSSEGGGGGAATGSVLLGGGAASNALGMSGDSESDDNEMGRLQALLEARGLPPHLFGALGPRMQHFLHRSMGSSTTSKAHQLLAGLQCIGDEGQQLQAVIEMCQLLVMGNEDTLAGFPVKQVVPALITLLHMEHNFDIMNHACRALTYMMEALPRSSAVVVDAIPAFLEKLQVIQCMDVAEQSLTALEMLSRRHSKSILQARGVSACLMYLDFFSVNAQRAALSITANCCQNLHADEFHYVEESLGLLASRLTQHDKKSVESVCLAFSRLVDGFQSDVRRLQEIASTELLANLQQLLVVSPPIMSTGTFIMVVRMMSIMCAHCPELAVKLLKQNISHTLCYLLTGPRGEGAAADSVELVSRSPQELYEITSLIGELMPRLPTEGLFGVDALLLKPSVAHLDGVLWQWRDDRGLWHPYSAIDSRIVEAAHQSGEDEISLSTMGRTYTLDFHSMQQINDETGTTRPVQRKVNHTGGVCPATGSVGGANGGGAMGLGHSDSRIECLREDADLANSFIRSLFSVLYEVYSSSAGPAVRHKCLRAVLRMLYYASPELLQDVLKNQQVSSHLAGMLSSQDLKIVVGALQMAHILMSKLPEVFGVQFRREGVVYQVQRLADPNTVLGTSTASSVHLSSATASSVASASAIAQDGPGPSHVAMAAALNGHMSAVMLNSDSGMENAEEMEDQSSQVAAAPNSQSRFGDVLKRKRGGKKNCGSSGRKTRPEGQPEPGKISPSLDSGKEKEKDGVKVKHSLSGSVGGLNGSKTSSFLASLNPARWGRSHTAPSTPPSAALPDRVYKSESCPLPKMLSNPHLAGNREKVKTWIREQAAAFLATYFPNESRRMSGAGTDADGVLHSLSDGTVLDRLTAAVRKLQANPGMEVLEEIREIVLHTDISSFEVIHSGLVPSLTAYLASEGSSPAEREQRNRTFLNVYLGCPLDPLSLESPRVTSPLPLQPLVAKLNACVNQLEQFPVRVHDLPGSAPGGGAMRSGVSALKFFYTHQLKCNLQRHPSCTTLKQWKGGAVKIDPLALVQAIEKYLVIRGYGRLRDKDAGDSDDDNSEEDIDDSLAAVIMNQGTMRHKLQFLINEHVIPYNMTVYEAVRQFGMGPHFEQSETDTDNEAPVGSASIWVHTHNIYYRPVPEYGASNASTSAGGVLSCSGGIGGAMGSSLAASSSRKGKGGAKPSSKKKGDELWNEGLAPEAISPLVTFWSRTLPESVTVEDPSLPLLNLLRILHALNRHWSSLYVALPYQDFLPPQEFINAKLTAKANRQLQDPLVIMTGNLPAWLQQVTLACPFLFPLDTRQLLFYATSFDRDRALQRLVDSVPELSHGDSQERVTPRLDRRKRTVSREDILKQAEQVLQDLGSSRALLEIQYENEVGTGLGPTLEFYALVSRELQRADLDLWRGTAIHDYVHHSAGLFPAPLPRNLKVAQLTRVRSKFRFLGKFVAKAIMDSRMLDLPFSLAMYRWLLGHEQEFTGADLRHVDPDFYRTYLSLCQVLAQKKRLEATTSLTPTERQEKIANLTLDGCSIEDLGLDFTVPSVSQIEMRRNGKDIPVTVHNLEHYLRCLSHWLLVEGVGKQMEALREGFESVFPLSQLAVFYPEELELVLCGASEAGGDRADAERWDAQMLMEAWKPDHGYTIESKPFRYLAQVLSTYTRTEQRKFLQFVTGSPRLPVGGFKSLSPPLTVVRKTVEANQQPDEFLPSVMTCVNYLKLPDYSSIEILREKLRIATQEGLNSFHLS